MDFQSTLIGPFEEMGRRVLNFLPSILGALLILLLGCLLASIIQKVVTRFLKLARLDTVSEKTGIANVLTKGDINYTLSEIVGVLIYWMIVLVVILSALNALQLTVAADLINKVVLYVPNVIASVFILVLGIFFGSIVANTVRTTAATAGIRQARSLGKATQLIIGILVFVEALKQLGIDTSLVDMILKGIIFALALGIGLAVGLGCKDLAGRQVNQFVDSFKAKK